MMPQAADDLERLQIDSHQADFWDEDRVRIERQYLQGSPNADAMRAGSPLRPHKHIEDLRFHDDDERDDGYLTSPKRNSPLVRQKWHALERDASNSSIAEVGNFIGILLTNDAPVIPFPVLHLLPILNLHEKLQFAWTSRSLPQSRTMQIAATPSLVEQACTAANAATVALCSPTARARLHRAPISHHRRRHALAAVRANRLALGADALARRPNYGAGANSIHLCPQLRVWSGDFMNCVPVHQAASIRLVIRKQGRSDSF
eukprot:6176511-Pleurochrysis_carterae.AAC.1